MVKKSSKQRKLSSIDELEDQILDAKKNGLTDREIGKKFEVNLRFIEKAITKHTGVNVSVPSLTKEIKNLQPIKFALETSTVWSFKSRGNWATHSGNYRGNWSPYIPRNIILRYSKENELVLDCFCGAGTTGVEAKLTNRNFIGLDINPNAIGLSKKNIKFPVHGSLFGEKKAPDIKFVVGDARDLSFLESDSIDLVCAHPPYADIIHYTDNHEQDLSFYEINKFLEEMAKVARENHRVLKKDRYCAILIGDMRRKKDVVPLGYWLINTYLENGFKLKELIIKRQHNCKTTGFWYKNSIKFNFLLLAHEYLAVFKKCTSRKNEPVDSEERIVRKTKNEKIEKLESTTVWIFDQSKWFDLTLQNLVDRYDGEEYQIIEGTDDIQELHRKNARTRLLIIVCTRYQSYIDFKNTWQTMGDLLYDKNAYLAILCNDIRLRNGLIFPMAIELEKILNKSPGLKIKELIFISIENGNKQNKCGMNLNISHKYLLVYRVNRGD